MEDVQRVARSSLVPCRCDTSAMRHAVVARIQISLHQPCKLQTASVACCSNGYQDGDDRGQL